MEISTSILSVKEENPIQTFYDIEVAKNEIKRFLQNRADNHYN